MLKQRIADLPDWATPPKEPMNTVLTTATGASDIEWDPMEANGSIVLEFDYEQPWMTKKNVKIYFGYRQHSTFPLSSTSTSISLASDSVNQRAISSCSVAGG
jgi:hypothetical protein